MATATIDEERLKTVSKSALGETLEIAMHKMKLVLFVLLLTTLCSVSVAQNTTAENELKELIAFYQTPTGQKAAAFLPGLSKQVEQAFSHSAVAQLRAIVGPKIEAEQAEFQQKLKNLKNKTRP